MLIKTMDVQGIDPKTVGGFLMVEPVFQFGTNQVPTVIDGTYMVTFHDIIIALGYQLDTIVNVKTFFTHLFKVMGLTPIGDWFAIIKDKFTDDQLTVKKIFDLLGLDLTHLYTFKNLVYRWYTTFNVDLPNINLAFDLWTVLMTYKGINISQNQPVAKLIVGFPIEDINRKTEKPNTIVKPIKVVGGVYYVYSDETMVLQQEISLLTPETGYKGRYMWLDKGKTITLTVYQLLLGSTMTLGDLGMTIEGVMDHYHRAFYGYVVESIVTNNQDPKDIKTLTDIVTEQKVVIGRVFEVAGEVRG